MIFVFGDSFAKFFTLVNKSVVSVYSFKGATLKGVIKPTNQNKISIENTISQAIKQNINITHIIFVFGQVDLNLSFYYDICKKNKSDAVENKSDAVENKSDAAENKSDAAENSSSTEKFVSHYDANIKEYIRWIASIPGKFKRIILATYPSPLNKEYAIKSLVKYGIFTDAEVEENYRIIDFYSNEINRKSRYFEFIYTLEYYCEEYCFRNGKKKHTNYNDCNLEFINLNEHLLDCDLNVKPDYLDISKSNIHLRWEPIIPLLIKKLSNIGVPISNDDIVKNINELELEYIKYKQAKILTYKTVS